jgi:thiamine biosynthesis lipoprotein
VSTSASIVSDRPPALSRFRAMGCDVVVSGGDSTGVAAVFARWEAVFSRFRLESELSRVNAAPEPALRVSALFAHALRVALDVARATDGLVDPTLGTALEHAGYDRDFARLAGDGELGPAAPSRLDEVRLDGAILRRPPGLRLDLNGVVKALAVDEAVATLPGNGFVSAGGDLAVRGPVDVGLPGGGAVRLVRGGLATSGSASRHWRRGGARQHHLIDPRTGRPARSTWQQVTVSGALCLDADAAAKAAFLLGDEGPAWLDGRGLAGRFVTETGRVVENRCWACATRELSTCT